MHKQDFSDVLKSEIERLEEIALCIEGEIKARQAGTEYLASAPVDYWINKKTIAYLKGELKSKTDFIAKLKDKKEVDDAEVEKDFQDLLDSHMSVINKSTDSITDPHDLLRLNYMKQELALWMGKPDDHESKKEASVFYFKGVKSILIECGIEL